MLIAACLALSSSCVLRPDWQKLAAEGELESSWFEGRQFRHRVLANGISGNMLRIYVEGDGEPWIRQTRVAVDPTPANPVLLRLMLGDIQPAVYLGRPCYFGSASDRGCDPALWTFDRYGKTVVESMCEAANALSQASGAQEVELVGYSGGGAIVLGMKSCTERLASLTTIAGNLDPDAWARHHDYSLLNDLTPVEKSMNVTDSKIETHWQCRDDRNIPPAITDSYFEKRGDAIRHIVDDCSHANGWERYRPRMLQ